MSNSAGTVGSTLVTIGLPVYNGERFLRQTLDAVLSQTYRHLEIVICDNASTDGTSAICMEYAARDSRVRYTRNERNLGIAGNFRRAVELASGEFFTWACADDGRPLTAIEEGVKAFGRSPGAVMVHGPVGSKVKTRDEVTAISNAMNTSQSGAGARVRNFTECLRHNAMLYGLYRRDIVARARFVSHYGQDYLVCLQVCQAGPVEYVQTPLVVYRERREPIDNPMYPRLPLTLRDLLFYRGVRRTKCWIVLLSGCYYMLADSRVPLAQRREAVAAHVTAFVRRYPVELASECVFIAFTPLMWGATAVAPALQRIVGYVRRVRGRARRIRSVS